MMKHIGESMLDIDEKELLTSKFKTDNLDEIKRLTSLFLNNLEICMFYASPVRFNNSEEDVKELMNLSNLYIEIIRNIVDKWHVDNTMNIISFLDKTTSFKKYMDRYIETPDEENFIFVEGLYDNLLVHSKKV